MFQIKNNYKGSNLKHQHIWYFPATKSQVLEIPEKIRNCIKKIAINTYTKQYQCGYNKTTSTTTSYKLIKTQKLRKWYGKYSTSFNSSLKKNSDCSMLDHVNGKFWNIMVDIKHFFLQQTGEKLGNRTKVHITI